MTFRALLASRLGAMRLMLVCGSAVVCLLGLAACEKKVENAIVTGKERIPAAPATGVVQDERQVSHERWLIEVTMENGRRASVDVEKRQWDALKVGNRVRMRFSEGEYSHTIWSADLEKL